MAATISAFLRALVFCLAVCALIPLFLHEDEQGKLQSRLEALWIRIHDRQLAATSRHTAFLTTSADFLSHGFDIALGPKLFSMRSIAVTFACCVISAISYTINWGLARGYRYRAQILMGALSFGLLWLVLDVPKEHGKERKTWSDLILAICALAVLLAGLATLFSAHVGFWVLLLWEGTLFAVGLLCGVFFVALNRAIVRIGARLKSGSLILLLLICNLLIAAVYLTPAIATSGNRSSSLLIEFAVGISTTNIFTACSAAAIFGVMFLALLHRLFWPAVGRTVYAFASNGVVRNRRLLFSIAVMLLTWALPGWRAFWAFIRHL